MLTIKSNIWGVFIGFLFALFFLAYQPNTPIYYFFPIFALTNFKYQITINDKGGQDEPE
jgi:hypothetical protein